MPLSKNINSYADVQAVLQAARKSGVNPCRYRLETKGLAVNWRARAFMYRKLLREQLTLRAGVPGYTPATEWDDLMLDLDDREVIIKFGLEIAGQLLAAGKAVTVGPIIMEQPIPALAIEDIMPAVDTDLEREALELIKRMGAEE